MDKHYIYSSIAAGNCGNIFDDTLGKIVKLVQIKCTKKSGFIHKFWVGNIGAFIIPWNQLYYDRLLSKFAGGYGKLVNTSSLY